MKNIKEYINESFGLKIINESTGIKIIMPPFEYAVILQSLRAYAENNASGKEQADSVIEYLEDFKNVKWVGRRKIDREFRISSDKVSIISKALEAYIDNDDRKNNQKNGRPTDDQLNNVIKWFNDFEK